MSIQFIWMLIFILRIKVSYKKADCFNIFYSSLPIYQNFLQVSGTKSRSNGKISREERVLPIYVEVPDDIRLIRAIDREKKQEKPAYEEMCRRFLADSEDFSEENLEKTGISRRFSNAGTLEECLTEIRQFIKEKKGFTNFS